MKHGLNKHPLYKIWTKIKDRLYNPNHEAYHRYGGNGVVMCEEWLNNPVAFIQWALDNGWRKGLHIDKDIIPMSMGIEPKIYSPQTCSIVTPKVNCRNASYNVFIEFNGKKQTVIEWSEELNIDYATLHHRLFDFGYSVEDALTLPIGYKKNILYEHNGVKKTINEWCKEYQIKRSTFVERLKRGYSFYDALNKKLYK